MWVWVDHACLTSRESLPAYSDIWPTCRGSLPTYNASLHTHASVVHLEVLVSEELSVLAKALPNITKLQIFVMPPLV